MEKEFKNPFIFDKRPIPCISVHFRTLLDIDDSNKRQLWSKFISKVMREEKSKYKYSQIPLIREFLYSQSKIDINSITEYVSSSMKDSFSDIEELLPIIDKDTFAFILAISGFNVKEYLRTLKAN